MSKIFGGSKSRQQSQQTSSSSSVNYNRAYQPIEDRFFNPSADLFKRGSMAVNDQLAGDFNTYRDRTGFDFFEKLGLRKQAGSFAGRGAFQSGAALKSLANYESQLEKASYTDYLEALFKQAQLGLQGGGLVAGAGQYGSGTSSSQGTSSGSSSSNEGMGKFLGTIIGAAAASDERLKKDVVKLGEYENGLGIYQYNYIDGRGPFVGVMAQEVKDILPEALGPEVDGYMTVNYGMIPEPWEHI